MVFRSLFKEIHAAIFDIFGENLLTQINTNTTAESIRKFKQSIKTKKAFKCLFKADDDRSLLYIQAIRNKAWGKKKTTEKDTAFTLAVTKVLLNPKYLKISIENIALRKRYNAYLIEVSMNTTKSIRIEELGGKKSDNTDIETETENRSDASNDHENLMGNNCEDLANNDHEGFLGNNYEDFADDDHMGNDNISAQQELI
ncbi:hypothetical protein C1646_821385 [Rhizophagus diaphanus]|nr:hypothetical protein C1646_821385 [Rhizophagus diaphanus] [Rhizophagus sp. MUCL 43196]